MIAVPNGLPRGGSAQADSFAEVCMRHALAAVAETISSVGLIGLGAVVPSISEPTLGALVSLAPDERWKLLWLSGAAFVTGVLQLFFVAKGWTRARQAMAWAGITVGAAFGWAFYLVHFRGLIVTSAMLLVANILALVDADRNESRRIVR